MGNNHSYRAGKQYKKDSTPNAESFNSISSSSSGCVVPLGRPPDLKVLPDRVPGQRLRVTSNGQFLHTAGTLSGRQQHSGSDGNHHHLSSDENHHRLPTDESRRYQQPNTGVLGSRQELVSSTSNITQKKELLISRAKPKESNTHCSTACHKLDYELENSEQHSASHRGQLQQHVDTYPDNESFSEPDLISYERGQIRNKSRNKTDQFDVVDSPLVFHSDSSEKESHLKDKLNYEYPIQPVDMSPMMTTEPSHKDRRQNHISAKQANSCKRALEDNEHNSPSKFYFGMSSKRFEANTITSDDSSDLDSAEHRTSLVTRIPSCTLHEFVRNLENSRRRQLSVNRQEIASNSIVDIDYKLNQNEKYDATFNATDGNAISMELKPSVPRKQLTIPTFSPRAAWKELDPEVFPSMKTSNCTVGSLSCVDPSNHQMSSNVKEKNTNLNHNSGFGYCHEFQNESDSAIKKLRNKNRNELNDTEMLFKSNDSPNDWIPAEDLESLQSSESKSVENDNLFVGTEPTVSCMSALQSPAEVFSSRVWSDSNAHFVDDSEQKMYGLSMASVLRAFSGSKQHRIDENWLLSRSMPSFDVIGQREPLENMKTYSCSSIHSDNNDTGLQIIEPRPGPEMNRVENRSDSNNRNDKSKTNQKLSPIARYQRRFSYQSTIRVNQKQKSEKETSKKIEEKEKKINEEQLAQQKFEEEFRKNGKNLGNGLKVQQLCKSFEDFQVKSAQKSNTGTIENQSLEKQSIDNNNVHHNHQKNDISVNLSTAFNRNLQPRYKPSPKKTKKIPSCLQSKLLNRASSPNRADVNFPSAQPNEFATRSALESSPPYIHQHTHLNKNMNNAGHSPISARQNFCPLAYRDGQKRDKARSPWIPTGCSTDQLNGYHEPGIYIPEFSPASNVVHSPASSASGGGALSSGYGSSTGEGRCSSAEQNKQSQARYYRGGTSDLYPAKENTRPIAEASFDAYQPGFYYKKNEQGRSAAIPARLKRGQARMHQHQQPPLENRQCHFPRSASQHELRPRHNWLTPMMPRVGSELILYRSPSLRTHTHQITRYGGQLLPSYAVNVHANDMPSQWLARPYQKRKV